MNELVVHTVDVAHYRLIELTKLADQAKPFYEWVERKAKQIFSSHHSLHDILLKCPKIDLHHIINSCFFDENTKRPLLFDGIGRVYPHYKACFYFFAWMIRDAPQQRLAPLISRMQKTDNITKRVAEIDTLVELIYEYRNIVKNFEWQTIKEVIIDRLEGSRRSISGHRIESHVRISLITAIQTYYAIYSNYGIFSKISIADKQIKLGHHTIDLSVSFTSKHNKNDFSLLIPIKTRETEGGGHSHLFTRDIIAAISDITSMKNAVKFAVVIIADNWAPSELQSIQDKIDIVFYFNMNPNKFFGFDEESQISLNKYLETLFLGI